jgi:hypothetical protein
LAFVLIGYAVLGRAFAYISVGPIYVGEIVLALGVCHLLQTRSAFAALKAPAMAPLLLTMAWGAARLAPELPTYGMLAMRDAAVWGYGLFAFIVAATVLSHPWLLCVFIRYYSRFVPIAVIGIAVVWLASSATGYVTFVSRAGPMPIIKGSELMTHLCGIVAFIVFQVTPVPVWWLLSVPTLFVMGMNTRAGILSFIISLLLIVSLRPMQKRWIAAIHILLVLLVALSAFEIELAVPGASRALSADTLFQSIRSIFDNTSSPDYEATKAWRLRWWSKIVDYTWNGEYFWTGKGFGLNVAYDDGYAYSYDAPLRSPHNSHLTMLARGGVPGFVLWCATQIVWACVVLRCIAASALAKHDAWCALFRFLFVYWVAFVVNASFDVFLEGPMAAIWYWTVYGFGIAATVIYRRMASQFERASHAA